MCSRAYLKPWWIARRDRLEQTGAELDGVSRSAFHSDKLTKRERAKASEQLRGVLRKIGQAGDRLSHIRDHAFRAGPHHRLHR